MEQDQLLQGLNKLFKEVFNDPKIEISPQTSINDIESWNSLNHVVLIDKLEKQYNIKFELEEVLGFMSIEDILNAIRNKIS